MVPATYLNYFLASTGASAALIGLLFVAISLAPESIFGKRAPAQRRAQATSAFTALLDAFFVSIVALIPNTNLGYTALLMGGVGVINTLSLAQRFWEEHVSWQNAHQFTLLLGSLVIYVWELWFAIALLHRPRDAGPVDGLSYLLLGAYALGVARAWGLLGAQNEGLFTLLRPEREPGEPAAAPGAEDEGTGG